MNTKIQIPKGSYHAFCRKIYGGQDFQHMKQQTHYKNQRRGQPKTVQTERSKRINQFSTFEQYLAKFNNTEESDPIVLKNMSKTVEGKKRSSQPTPFQQSRTQAIRHQKLSQKRQLKNKNQKDSQPRTQRIYNSVTQKKGTRQLVGAFLPFFKIKLQKEEEDVAKQKKQFKIDNRKFRLKSLLIQENKFVTQKWFPAI